MSAVEQNVAGLKCSQVLERLSDYLDGELPAAERTQVEAHLAGCDACTRFGGEFTSVVNALHHRLGGDGDVDQAAADRLDALLRR